MKLPNGYGSVYKLSGKRRKPWAARITVGWRLVEDKQKSYPEYQFLGYYKTKTEALQALAEYNKDPYDLNLNKITFSELYDKWADEYFSQISEKSSKIYGILYKAVLPEIREMQVKDIKLDHLQMALDKSGKNKPMVKRMKSMFNLMWDCAVKHEIVEPSKKEIISYLDYSKASNPKKVERSLFTDDEIGILFDHVSENEYYQFPLILIYTGVRVGELFDLKAEDVHLNKKYFEIKKSKTAAGIREVPIADKVLPFFKHWLDKKGDYVFCNTVGHKMAYANFRITPWKAVDDLLGTEHKPHDCRHTCISKLTDIGTDPRIIKQIVGHSGKDVTEQVYTHISMDVKLEAINKI